MSRTRTTLSGPLAAKTLPSSASGKRKLGNSCSGMNAAEASRAWKSMEKMHVVTLEMCSQIVSSRSTEQA